MSAIAVGTLVTFFWDLDVVKRQLPPMLAQRDAIFPALIAALGVPCGGQRADSATEGRAGGFVFS